MANEKQMDVENEVEKILFQSDRFICEKLTELGIAHDSTSDGNIYIDNVKGGTLVINTNYCIINN